MTEDDDDAGTDESYDHDGRSIKIDTGFYQVQVWGDPDYQIDHLRDLAFAVADRARHDVEQLDDRLDGDDKEFS